MNRDANELVFRAFGMVVDVDGDADAQAKQLRQFLVVRIAQIMDREFGKLPQFLYQVDVSEQAVTDVFRSAERTHDIPEMLADLVLERIERISMARHDYATRGST